MGSANLLIPPIIFMAIRRLRRAIRRSPEGSLQFDLRPEWELVPEGWRADDPRAAGWHHPSVVEKHRHGWAIYSQLIRDTGPLGFNFYSDNAIVPTDEKDHNVFMTFAYVIARAAHGSPRLSVLDWGGGIGYFGLVAQRLLPEVALDYVVKELPELSALGRELMPSLSFVTDDETCFSRRYDLVFASTSIQYSRDWRASLARLAAAAGKWLFVTLVPILRRASSFVVVQRPYHFGYHTEYISWVLNREELLMQASSLGLTLEREFVAGRSVRIRNAPEKPETLGFLWRVPLD
jgi:putative methyltransferase (TIGR04325 family)